MYHNSYLMHHGVKGQQWGVRHGPPYPIEDKVLRKGERLRNVQGGKSVKDLATNMVNSKYKPFYTYNANNEWDNHVYKGPFAQYLVRYRGAQFVAEREFEVMRDLKMPNKQERINAFTDMYNNPKLKKDLCNDLKAMQDVLVQRKMGSKDEQKRYAAFDASKTPTTKQDIQTAYEIFNHSMQFSWYFNSTKHYTKYMSKKYDAMVDDNNQRTYNDARDPVIIFRANKVLREHGDAKLITMDEINAHRDAIEPELKKQGINIKL